MATSDSSNPEDLSDDELLERIAEKDPERFPVVEDARRALGWDQEDS